MFQSRTGSTGHSGGEYDAISVNQAGKFQSLSGGQEIIPRSKRAVFPGLDTEASSPAK